MIFHNPCNLLSNNSVTQGMFWGATVIAPGPLPGKKDSLVINPFYTTFGDRPGKLVPISLP